TPSTQPTPTPPSPPTNSTVPITPSTQPTPTPQPIPQTSEETKGSNEYVDPKERSLVLGMISQWEKNNLH
ncbi:MAG: hypothetical protein WBE60_06195, partial [Nitrosotalea sp.]